MSSKSPLGCSILVAVSAVGGLMVHRSALDAAEDMHEVVQAKEAQRMIQDCAATVEQADTAYEAALLTGDRGYLLVFLAALPTLREKVQSLLAASSDELMYEVKKSGKNAVASRVS
jgi:CHASE3 domain sensor protein